ncbi:MAG: DUF4301 family protein [Flavobacteriales bacterium]|nr:DUF4301 family protein [Flavobacteriales bacterium]
MNAPEVSLFQLTLDECKRRLTQAASPLDVVRPCTVGDGVERWSLERVQTLADSRENRAASDGNCALWVPASGAATRMFSFLQADSQAQARLWSEADRLAFGVAWKEEVARVTGGEATAQQAAQVLWDMFDLGKLPKGLVPFHSVEGDGTSETAFEAHLRLWSHVMPNGGHVWFTVQEGRQAQILEHLAESAQTLGFHLELPHQDPATDTPMLDDAGAWIKDDQGEVLRRPGGHGALLPLLEQVTTPFVVIRNVDNAPSPACTDERLLWTQAMLEEAHVWSKEREDWRVRLLVTGDVSSEMVAWLNQAGAGLTSTPTLEECVGWLTRPMRLVGVVRNEGQPGGGPFWVRVSEGSDAGLVRPQIVEAVEFTGETQEVLSSASHFNPVDMVCVLNPGQALSPYVDASRHLRAKKTVFGRDVRVLEHPGLWNGGMSGWLTRFVEMPASCFQPVKSALDLIGRQ